ncbi:unnamed protein product [Cylicocyclus nassatus]|uniref:NTR domain-containing protein n=1 Tax=Cylicocyclus nassatus TaxID=53992 RepID=A0AA36M6R5_CYLNA|nr:unnamed protein product [Cylicocyclus nassatus]
MPHLIDNLSKFSASLPMLSSASYNAVIWSAFVADQNVLLFNSLHQIGYQVMRTVIFIISVAASVVPPKKKCCNLTLMDQFCGSEVLIFAKVLSSKYDNNSILHEYKVNESYVLKDDTGTVPDVNGITSVLVENTPCSRPLRTDFYLIGGRLVQNDIILLNECGFYMSDRMINRSERRQRILGKIAKEDVCGRR